jgi:prepilin-type N-terminal cleavage/methylation domain-containing protein
MRRRTSVGRTNAFTVVEMMIVLAIIGALVALALPAYRRMAGRADQGHCSSNLRQIFVALSNYATANSGVLPTNLPGGEYDIPWPAGISAPTGQNADLSTNEIGHIGRTAAARSAVPPRVPRGLGKLHAELGDNLAVLYCPRDGLRSPVENRTAFLADQMLTNGDPPNSSYLYRGRAAPDPADLTAIRRLGAQTDTVRALAMDYYVAGAKQPNHGDRICILFENGQTLVVRTKDRFVDAYPGVNGVVSPAGVTQAALVLLWQRADAIHKADD